MGRASTLSLHERGQLKALKAITKFFCHQEEYGTKKSSGQLSKLNDRGKKGSFTDCVEKHN
uniref:Ovule protein n=1 Tax=Heterorhabditis bacteriophora TaxID=37862 RepID=A0A1I7WG55_HETBA